MIILGIDPGITTGFALVDVASPSEFTRLQGGTVRGFEGISKLMILTPEPDAVVVENFVLWPRLAVKVSQDDPNLLTVRYIGAITFWCQFISKKTLVFQQPTYKKACPDFLLRRLGLLQQSSTGHENDALRHVVVYARKEFSVQRTTKKIRDVVDWENGR